MPRSVVPTITVDRQPPEVSSLMGSLKGLLAIGFASHDNRLLACLRAGVGYVETYTGLLLSTATVSVTYAGYYDEEALPYPPTGPVVTTTSAGVALVPKPQTTYASGLVFSYPSGVDLDTAPNNAAPWLNALREAVLQAAAERFDGMARDWKKDIASCRYSTWAQ